MGHYDVQQVCLNGHQITDKFNSSPQFGKKFCDYCGAETIHQCPECNHFIKGEYVVADIISFDETSVPTHCENCGSPYPWTSKKSKSQKVAQISQDSNPMTLLTNVCLRFHLVATQLNIRYNQRTTLVINDEYDVQDLMHALLRLHFDDVRSEEWTPSYAGSSSRVDFLLKDEQIVIEVKKTRPTLKAKDVGEQLIIDIERYQTHPDCKLLLCFVYDPEGIISNPRGLENDLNRKQGRLDVKVLIVPRGH
jgi:hypothetical protein